MRSGRVAAKMAAALVAAALGGCTAAAPEGALIADPYERLNRDIHEFNRGWDQVLIRPASQAYDAVTPALFKHLIYNLDRHLRLPVDAVNYVLQGDLEGAGETVLRFVANTALGAGVLDPATELGLPYQPNDFGKTLARWGAGEGVFVMLPLLGPSTARDSVGLGVDFAIDPFNFIAISDEVAIEAARLGLPIVDLRSRNDELFQTLFYDSPDSYATVRSAYVQARRRAVGGGETDPGALPDIFDEDE
ncbi:MAG: VacJ family lipoprotein [Rubrimonas sp.]|uniref:MlaA family lipoprotein n=1 Tax=Rubrimonas sp. TaxID=2036015 RepID=UPI002FDD5995